MSDGMRAGARVVHMTSVHDHDDMRIFAKECRTLAELGYDVHYIAPGAPDERRDGVRLWPVSPPASQRRAVRMTWTVAQVLRVARGLDGDVYHFHDPELVPVGVLLSALGKHVIYDVHEDVPADILAKSWIRPKLRTSISRLAATALPAATDRFAAVVAATPTIEERYTGRGRPTVAIGNYPALAEFDGFTAAASASPTKERAVCYLGGVSEIRGASVMVRAMAATDATLLLAGHFEPPELRDELATLPEWSQVTELGLIDRYEVMATLSRSAAGLVLYGPVPNHIAAQPTKIYEYMAAGIPVIASDFPLWRTIVEGSECGLCVDPTDPDAVRRAIAWIFDSPREAERMGRNGRRAVETRYSWEPEARKLASLYETVLR